MEHPAKRGYNIQEAAAYLGVSVSTLRKDVAANRIGTKRKGALLLFDVRELDRYFDALPSERAMP